MKFANWLSHVKNAFTKGTRSARVSQNKRPTSYTACSAPAEKLQDRVMLTDPTISILGSSFGESDGNGAFYIYADDIAETDLQVVYEVVPGTATPGEDFDLASGYVTIPAGMKSAEIYVSIYDDFKDEGDETFTVNLFWGDDVASGTGSVVATIHDDESPIPIAIVDGDLFGEADIFGSIYVAADNYSDFDLTISYEVVDGSARNGLDFNASSGTVVIPAGSNYTYIGIELIDDLEIEPDEQFGIQLTGASFGTIVQAHATVIIHDNEQPLSVAIFDADFMESDGQSAINVSSDNPVTSNLQIGYEISSGSATNNTDYFGQAGTVTIPEGSDFAPIPVEILDDLLNEPDETFSSPLKKAAN